MSEQTATLTPAQNIDTEFKNLYDSLATFSKQGKELQDQLKSLQRACKQAEKQTRTIKKKPQEKLNLSKELANFLSVDSSTKLTKAEVMKGVSEYIKTKNLQLESNKRKFKPNKELSKVFGMSPKSELTFVEINKHVSNHLSK